MGLQESENLVSQSVTSLSQQLEIQAFRAEGYVGLNWTLESAAARNQVTNTCRSPVPLRLRGPTRLTSDPPRRLQDSKT